jgi:hypothetical protein
MFNNKTKAVQDTKPFCRLSIPTARLRINFERVFGSECVFVTVPVSPYFALRSSAAAHHHALATARRLTFRSKRRLEVQRRCSDLSRQW